MQSGASKIKVVIRWAKHSSALLLCLIAGCEAHRTYERPPILPEVPTKAYSMYKLLEAQRKYGYEGSGAKRPPGLEIFGSDIQLPVTADSDVAFTGRVYSFFVLLPISVTEKHGKSAWEMWKSGEIDIDVLGANATFSFPNHLPPELATNNTVANAVRSRTIEVKVKSDDIRGPLRIEAALPKEFGDFEAQNRTGSNSNTTNPFKTSRQVRVYYGDLRTQVEIVSQDEASASFGANFARYFYVGKIFLRNQNHEKRLLVYTTSLKANVLLYRPPVTNANHIPNPDLTLADRGKIAALDNERRTSITNSFQSTETDHLVEAALATYKTVANDARDDRSTAAVSLVPAILAKSKGQGYPANPETNQIRLDAARTVMLSAWDACDEEIIALRTGANAALTEARHRANSLAAELNPNQFSPASAGTNAIKSLLAWGIDDPLG